MEINKCLKKKNYGAILLIFLATIALLIFIWRVFCYNVFGTFKTAIKFNQLKQSEEFYKNQHSKTVNYLKRVYPPGDEKKNDSLSYKDIAVMYNSLTFYYNCCFEQEQTDQFPEPIRVLDPDCCSKYPLPYTPYGPTNHKSIGAQTSMIHWDGNVKLMMTIHIRYLELYPENGGRQIYLIWEIL